MGLAQGKEIKFVSVPRMGRYVRRPAAISCVHYFPTHLYKLHAQGNFMRGGSIFLWMLSKIVSVEQSCDCGCLKRWLSSSLHLY
jgi:hypothetical protein